MTNEKQGAERAEQAEEEEEEQDIAESPIIGLDYGGVLVLKKDPQNHSCDDKNHRAMQVSDIPKESSKARR